MSLSFPLLELRTILQTNPSTTANTALNASVTGVTTDTRTLQAGDLFIALVGDKFDGHDFAQTAIARGAIALILSRPLPLSSDIPQFIVADTLQAYQRIASWWRDRFNIPIIGVTGSVGKTSTKELISAVLGTRGKVLKTEANFNNEIGVPKTLLEITEEHQYAVIEMAMRGKGEIALLTEIARPTIGIITNVGTAHIGRLGSREAIAAAKCELLEKMPDSSVAVLNYDNHLLIETAARVWQGETITYGLSGGDITGELIDEKTLRVDGIDLPLPLAGIHHASNYLGAIAVARVLGIDLDSLTAGLTVTLPKGRSRRYDLSDDIVLLDETYNAGLESMLAAVEMLEQTPGKRHIAVLGTMKELGDYASQLHQEVGEKVKELELDLLLVLADEPATEAIATGAKGIPSQCFSDRDTLTSYLAGIITPGDRILFKASNSVGLDRVVGQLIEMLKG
jgi:UDP-N-acetylmuramoyl-tripeptide--D-alanyl-D-alanine ligase